MPYDLIVVFGLAAVLTALVLVFAHHLDRKHLQDFVSDFYAFLLFRSPMALLGKPLMTLIARSMHLRGTQLDQFQVLIDGFVMKPLWIFSVYFLLRCFLSFRGNRIPRSATAAYFAFGGAYLVLAWSFMFQFFRAGGFTPGVTTFENISSWMVLVVAVLVYVLGIQLASGVPDGLRRRGLRIFAWIGFLSQAGFLLLIFLYHGFNLPVLVSAALPLPALLYLSSFLKRYTPTAPGDAAVLGSGLAGFGLTPREAEIIAQVCAGRSNKAIGQALFISVHTVKRHVNQVYQKVGVKNRVQLANLIRNSQQGSPLDPRRPPSGIAGP